MWGKRCLFYCFVQLIIYKWLRPVEGSFLNWVSYRVSLLEIERRFLVGVENEGTACNGDTKNTSGVA